VDVRELRPGLWRWTANHPEWTSESEWPQEVGCVYYEGPDAVVLVDPLVPPDDAARFYEHLDGDVERAARPVAIFLTVFWHHRSCAELAERYGARVWVHARDFRSTVEHVPTELVEPYELGEPLPGGVDALDADRKNEVLLWLREPRALVAGDVLLGTDDGRVSICPESWLDGQTREEVRETLREALELPVELLLLAHGAPIVEDAHAALERALA
jgi:glyoxylase-like metal-dependent hydrolase (beta-lactamase superfamily II)